MVYNTGMATGTIWIERAADEPVYSQIARQVRERIASGELQAGDLLPSVRALASDLGVSLNTVARAYRILEDEGFVAIRGRSGVAVAPPASRSRAGSRDALRSSLRETLARLRQAGVPQDEIERIVRQEIDALGAHRKPR